MQRSKLLSSIVCASLLGATAIASARTIVLPPDPRASAGPQPLPAGQMFPLMFSAPLNAGMDETLLFQDGAGDPSYMSGEYRIYEHVLSKSRNALSINTGYHATVSVFGTQHEALSIIGNSVDYANSKRTALAWHRILGQTVCQKTGNTTSAGQVEANCIRNYTKTLFHESETFTLAFIPVTVTGKLVGSLGLSTQTVSTNTAPTNLSQGWVRVIQRPSAGLRVTLSAAVGGWGVSAGVEGSLNILHLALDTNTMLRRTTSGGFRRQYVTLTVRALDGVVNLFASAFGYTYRKKIFDWDTEPVTTPLAHKNGSFTYPRQVSLQRM